ncbi:type IV secretion system protein VirE1 [Bradyrhizobium sp. CCGUVB23]|uniref:type IV secretion system protein VirE1 n=1 Tax=Bradyrhizobium sp. CCGUVB23 TaxID=2949630 RepID=UPI0020B43F8A|nr:type IV secretion system protein VirE1 [Bradyrhizobium sp. CCGUVB23]MCP3468619.1 type IV secretion system protein VirE1 [Bradyrhizobium sp. CCGUVB23]
MTTIKLGTNNRTSALSVGAQEDDFSVTSNRDQHSGPFTKLDLDMIELEDFINQCPLPKEGESWLTRGGANDDADKSQ